MLSIKALSQFVHMHEFWAFVVLILGVIIEGELVLILAGILSYLGGISFYEALIFAFLGAILKTILWYMIGLGLKIKYPNSTFFAFLDRKIHYFLPHFKDNPFWSILISKFIYGINHFTLIFAGYIKVKYKTYFKAELISSIIWVTILISVGYFFSHTALNISRDFRKFSLIIFGLFILFMALQRLLIFLYQVFEERKDEIERKNHEFNRK